MTRTIKELRILPPFAIARLGSADEPMDNYTIELDAPDNQDQPLGYRALKPLPTLIVGERSGEIEEVRTPQLPLQFKVHGKNGEQIRPVAPFLEVFAVVETGKKEDELVPLTVELLRENGLSVKDVSWTVSVANRKVARRTGDDNDVVKTDKVIVGDHDIHTLHGHCNNFESTHDNSIEFGQVRFIKPNAKHPEIRLRFTPARGLIYGPKRKAGQPFPGSADGLDADSGDDAGPPYEIPPDQDVYDPDKGIWAGYQDTSDHSEPGDQDPQELKAWKKKRNEIWARAKWDPTFDNETLPPALFAIDPPAPSWLYDNVAISRGYLDDACDGFVEVRIARPGEDPDKSTLKATARICSAPPAMAPDSLFVRSLADDLDQACSARTFDEDEDPDVTRARAQDIVRRAFETVRFMNVAVMNGNDFKGRSALSLELDARGGSRRHRARHPPGDAPGQRSTPRRSRRCISRPTPLCGPGPRRGSRASCGNPIEAADFTDHGRRKMPALMCGADNNYLALTWRQIHTIEKAASDPPPSAAADPSRFAAADRRATYVAATRRSITRPRGIRSVRARSPRSPIAVRGSRSISAPSGAGCSRGSSCASTTISSCALDHATPRHRQGQAGLQGRRLLRVCVGPTPEDAIRDDDADQGTGVRPIRTATSADDRT